MKEIKLTQGKVAMVDDEDYEYLNQWKWSAKRDPRRKHVVWYAIRRNKTSNKQTDIYLHWHILGKPPKGFFTDHIDRNGLNNCRSNLRFATPRQNSQNHGCFKTSFYPGVHWDKKTGKWRAKARINGPSKHLGLFPNEHDAFLAYQQALKEIGEEVIYYNR